MPLILYRDRLILLLEMNWFPVRKLILLKEFLVSLQYILFSFFIFFWNKECKQGI